ncbi:hypothetical protein EOT10_37710 [Streptomyces antnestii]|uniref:Holin n=1 Tax=Streptomyces antnestii TaxID=2494256 RepID=A0A437P0W6_9ACTN|nr:hypothetical protein [Streptomyces sp. San01]RVU15865.1 hypothetical protein EOT10_37710 [Streptomyces sp. San01]
MPDLMEDALAALGRGLLTQLPAQLVVGIAAAAVTGWISRRYTCDHVKTTEDKSPAGPDKP